LLLSINKLCASAGCSFPPIFSPVPYPQILQTDAAPKSPANHIHNLVNSDLAQVVPHQRVFVFYPDSLEFFYIRQAAKTRALQPGVQIVNNTVIVTEFYGQGIILVGNYFYDFHHICSLPFGNSLE
jgi:hypothetical protein